MMHLSTAQFAFYIVSFLFLGFGSAGLLRESVRLKATREESARKDTLLQGQCDELAELNFARAMAETTSADLEDELRVVKHQNSQLEGEKRVERSRYEGKLKEVLHREGMALQGWQHADHQAGKAYQESGALCLSLEALLASYPRLKDENATLRQTSLNHMDIADSYEAERVAAQSERDEYKRQLDITEEQRDDYAQQGVGLMREAERLTTKVQELEAAKQGRDEHGRFLGKQKLSNVTISLEGIGRNFHLDSMEVGVDPAVPGSDHTCAVVWTPEDEATFGTLGEGDEAFHVPGEHPKNAAVGFGDETFCIHKA